MSGVMSIVEWPSNPSDASTMWERGDPVDRASRIACPSGSGCVRQAGFVPGACAAGDRLEGRRRELFALAAPVFRRHGYRGATMKALAHACGLSPASLHHYFGSKEELATYVVRRPRMDWDSTWVDPAMEPLVQFRLMIGRCQAPETRTSDVAA